MMYNLNEESMMNRDEYIKPTIEEINLANVEDVITESIEWPDIEDVDVDVDWD